MSLAQLFFDGFQPSGSGRPGTISFDEPFMETLWLSVKDALCHGFSINHAAPVHKVLADYAAIDAATSAQRFRVEPSEYGPLVQLGIDFIDLGIPVRMPALPLWIEFPLIVAGEDDVPQRTAQGGVIITDVDERPGYMAALFSNKLSANCVVPHGYLFFEINNNEMTGSINTFTKGTSAVEEQNIINCVWTAVRVAAALNVPRVVTKTAVTWQPALNKARLKRGKHPMLSFNKVSIHLPKTHKHSGNTMRRERGAGVRFHGVLGHLRRIERPYGPDVTWVTPHFRGDPRLGVVVKERTLKTSA